MSPFSKVEMSPFVLLQRDLGHERYGAGGSPTTNESNRANAAGSNPTSKAKNITTTASSGVVVAHSAPGKAFVSELPGRRSRGTNLPTAWSTFKQSAVGEKEKESAAVVAHSLS